MARLDYSDREAPTLDDLRFACNVLRASGQSSAVVVAQSLGAVLAGDDPFQALGLKGQAGHRSALTLDRHRRRDALIRRLAARHFANMSTSEQARGIMAVAAAYWRRAAALDRELHDMPPSYEGGPRELLFAIARLPADMPKERTVRAILSKAS